MTFDQTDLSTGPDPSWTEEERAEEALWRQLEANPDFIAEMEQARADIAAGKGVSAWRQLDAEFRGEIERGLDDMRAGRTRPWSEIRPTAGGTR